MKNTAIFKQQYAPYQSYRIAGFDAVMNTGACLLGSVHGEHGALKAVVTEAATAHDQWYVVNLESQHNFDSIAVLGAVDEVEASSLALMHYGHLFDSANVHVDTMETSVYGLKRHLDSAYYHDKPRLIQPWQLNELQDVATAEKPMWDNMSLKSHSGQLSTLLFDMQCHDDHNGLLNSFDGLASYLEQIGAIEQAFDSIIVDYQHLEYFMGLLHKAMNNASKSGVQVENIEISKPFKRKGVAQVAISYLMKDGQSITILFHNPDSTPSKLAQSDTLISWKTLLNRRDVTGVVQPNQGEGLSMPVLAGRIMQLVNKNSARFVRTQAKKQQVQKEVDEAQIRLQEKQAKLEKLNADIESVKKKLDEVQQSQVSQPLEQPNTGTKQSDVVVIQGDEFGEFPDTPEGKKELRAKAKEKLNSLVGQWIDCPALGGKVEIRKSGVKKIFSLSGDPRKLKGIAYLSKIIEKAVLSESTQPNNIQQEKNVRAYHYLRTLVELGSQSLTYRIVIKEDDKGQCHYDFSVLESLFKEKIPSFDGILSATATCDRGVVNISPDLPVSCVANLEISLENKQNNVNESTGSSGDGISDFDSVSKESSAINYKSGDQLLGADLLASSQPSVPTHKNTIQINGNSNFNEFDSVGLDESDDGEYVLNLFIEGEDYAVNTDRSTSPTVTDTSNDYDVEYLQGILDGKIDFADHQQTDDMVAKLEEIHERLTPESQLLFEKVANAFAAYAISLEV